MATAVALPTGLRNRIAAVARRVRRLRFLRGLSLLVLLLTVGFGAALAADFFLDLSSPVRIGIFGAWAGLGLIVFVFGLLAPMSRRLDDDALAAVIEEKYPDLGERLTSTVELAGAGDDYHGSPRFIDHLMRDTETRALRFQLPSGRVEPLGRWLTAGAIALLILTLSPSIGWPDQYADLAGRFFRPWITPPAFAIDAAPAETFAARGRPLQLTAHLTPLRTQSRRPTPAPSSKSPRTARKTASPCPPSRKAATARPSRRSLTSATALKPALIPVRPIRWRRSSRWTSPPTVRRSRPSRRFTRKTPWIRKSRTASWT